MARGSDLPPPAIRSDEPRFPLVLVDVAAGEADEVAALLFELGAGGVEERDDQTLTRGPGSGQVTLVGSFAGRVLAENAAAALEVHWSPRVEEVLGDEWRDAWKRYFVPFHLTERVTIKPPWEAYQPSRPGEIVIELEPGRAFGTGLHATTALVARALEARATCVSGARVLDVGTGSGILALLALALGASTVRAIDVDADAIEVARDNFRRNDALARIEADTAPLQSIGEAYDVVTANIEARVLIAMAEPLARCVGPGGVLILSGILEPQASEVRAAFPALVLEEAATFGEWIALVLERPLT
jgi:ribosomal protein L11 methyltransferase